MKFAYGRTKEKDADVILFGVPDQSGSHAKRKGQAKGPDAIRKISNREAWVSETSRYQAQSGPVCVKTHDIGNIKKSQVAKKAAAIAKAGKKVAVLGGDHSITFKVLQGLTQHHKNIAVIYFDTHPDFVCSRNEKYFGSVMCDTQHLKGIAFNKSSILGIRAIEPEERKNIKKSGITSFTTLDIEEKGVKKVAQQIKKIVGKNKVYLSIDLDVLDPSVAPGVSTPYPGGLQTLQLLCLTKEFSKLNLVGFDIMEYTPKYDINDRTGHLATILGLEILKSMQ
ncbi:MAG: arginase family protein [Candidatus Nanoarchaeia archaeon]